LCVFVCVCVVSWHPLFCPRHSLPMDLWPETPSGHMMAALSAGPDSAKASSPRDANLSPKPQLANEVCPEDNFIQHSSTQTDALRTAPSSSGAALETCVDGLAERLLGGATVGGAGAAPQEASTSGAEQHDGPPSAEGNPFAEASRKSPDRTRRRGSLFAVPQDEVSKMNSGGPGDVRRKKRRLGSSERAGKHNGIDTPRHVRAMGVIKPWNVNKPEPKPLKEEAPCGRTGPLMMHRSSNSPEKQKEKGFPETVASNYLPGMESSFFLPELKLPLRYALAHKGNRSRLPQAWLADSYRYRLTIEAARPKKGYDGGYTMNLPSLTNNAQFLM